MIVLMTGKQDPRVMLALSALGADVVTNDIFAIRQREITGVWRDEFAMLAPEKHRSYGPPTKGRGGKTKRW